MMRPPHGLALATMLVVLVASLPALAVVPERPYEAPRMADDTAVPPLPPEYRSDDSAGIRFAYHPSARDRVRELIEDAKAVRAELSLSLGQAVLSSVDIRVARGSSDFERIVPAKAPRGTGVVAFGDIGMLVLSLRLGSSSPSDIRASFRRGVAYLALDEVAGPTGLPRWFRVGFALSFSREDSLSRSRSLWWASMRQSLVPLVDLDHHLGGRAGHGTVAAAQAADFVRFVLQERQRESFATLLASSAAGEPFDRALQMSFQQDLAALEGAWREDLAKHKGFLPMLVFGTGVWLLLAVAVRFRRRRAKLTIEMAEEPPESGDAPAEKPKKSSRTRHKRRAKKRLPTQHLLEPDVPKVSHNGRWHTLH